MKGYVSDIEKEVLSNDNFRKVLYTAKNCQLVLMSLKPGEDIGEEVHQLDQFFRIEHGTGTSTLDGVQHELKDGSAMIVPAGTRHNLINTGADAMKLYTIYAPPNHADGTLHKTKSEAEASAEHFDGKLSE